MGGGSAGKEGEGWKWERDRQREPIEQRSICFMLFSVLHISQPLLVHCSTGSGLTGLFLSLDYLLDQINDAGVVNIPRCVYMMRQQRYQMVSDVELYK